MTNTNLPALPEPTSCNVLGDQWNSAAVEGYGQSCYESGRVAGLEEAAAKDTKRLNAIECGMLFVEPQYQNIPATWAVGKAETMSSGKTLRAAIDAAMKATP